MNIAIDLLVFDFDGVLTDNRVWVMENGLEAVACHRGDGLGFDMLRKLGVPVLILSTESNPVVRARAGKLRVPVTQGVGDKAGQLRAYCQERGYALSRVLYVGNDLNDYEVMKLVGYAVAVADAHPLIRDMAWRVTRCRGGDGVVRELLEEILAIDPLAVLKLSSTEAASS
ncbi:MAG: HAD hydrolase family protein [Magnetococcales bacterium]|nr:HAD hydrolase family protein [Magnetococcales bacterium]